MDRKDIIKNNLRNKHDLKYLCFKDLISKKILPSNLYQCIDELNKYND